VFGKSSRYGEPDPLGRSGDERSPACQIEQFKTIDVLSPCVKEFD
jgi:hypothetical protein